MSSAITKRIEPVAHAWAFTVPARHMVGVPCRRCGGLLLLWASWVCGGSHSMGACMLVVCSRHVSVIGAVMQVLTKDCGVWHTTVVCDTPLEGSWQHQGLSCSTDPTPALIQCFAEQSNCWEGCRLLGLRSCDRALGRHSLAQQCCCCCKLVMSQMLSCHRQAVSCQAAVQHIC